MDVWVQPIAELVQGDAREPSVALDLVLEWESRDLAVSSDESLLELEERATVVAVSIVLGPRIGCEPPRAFLFVLHDSYLFLRALLIEFLSCPLPGLIQFRHGFVRTASIGMPIRGQAPEIIACFCKRDVPIQFENFAPIIGGRQRLEPHESSIEDLCTAMSLDRSHGFQGRGDGGKVVGHAIITINRHDLVLIAWAALPIDRHARICWGGLVRSRQPVQAEFEIG